MNQIQKKYVILGSLCALILTLAVGYAAFQTILKINGTTNINSNWDVKITAIEKTASVGATDNEGSPSYDNTKGLSATFNTNLTSPGDYATYKITITNNGSLDAILKNITIPENTNNDIIFYLNKDQNDQDIEGALKQNDTLTKASESNNVGYVYVTVLYKDYENQQTATTKTASMTISFDFEQADGSGGIIIGPSEGDETASDKLIALETTSGDGLYTDTYEPGRYVYKGANPNNYITFNNETWRIISVEVDGSLKIMKKDSIGLKAWDSTKSDNWAKPSTLNTYLNSTTDANSYYNNLSSDAKGLIQEHAWGIGALTYQNTDLTAQIASENGTTWNGNIGLISVSDYLRANTNTTECGNFSLTNTNYATCQTTNYLVPSSAPYWAISPRMGNTGVAFIITKNSSVRSTGVESTSTGVLPALYLIPNITLDGEGTSDQPYTINS